MPGEKLVFPKGFVWGTATAGHQIEGHNENSDWWKFEQEGKIYDGTKSGKNIDYWNRYEEDHELMSKLGYQGFRLGVEWAKIEPRDGYFDKKAIARYREILTSLRKHKIKICLTIYHWVLPLWFAEKGGWDNPKAVDRFIRYAEVLANELGEFPDLWVTLNEPGVPPTAGYLAGVFPPEKKNILKYFKVTNTLLRAHAKCYEMIHRVVHKAPDGGPTMAGVAQAYQWIEPFGSPGLAGAYEKVVAPITEFGSFGAWDQSVATGVIPFPFGLNEKVSGLKDSYDFCGINYYTRYSIKFDPSKPEYLMLNQFGIPEGMELNQLGWQSYPPGFFKTIERVWKLFKKPVVITENGLAEDGDDGRRKYTLEHLAQLHRAIQSGVDVRGYFHWSYIDNFEWREGFAIKLGLIECDYADPELKRIPRKSAHMYSDIIKSNAITKTIVTKYCPEAEEGVFGDKWRI